MDLIQAPRLRGPAGGNPMSERFDAVVIGAGPAGEVAVNSLAHGGLRVALLERELIGGECGYWACIPTKTLLRPPEVRGESSRVAGVSTFRLAADRRLPRLDDPQPRRLEAGRPAMTSEASPSIKGPGRLAGAGRVEAGGRVARDRALRSRDGLGADHSSDRGPRGRRLVDEQGGDHAQRGSQVARS